MVNLRRYEPKAKRGDGHRFCLEQGSLRQDRQVSFILVPYSMNELSFVIYFLSYFVHFQNSRKKIGFFRKTKKS